MAENATEEPTLKTGGYKRADRAFLWCLGSITAIYVLMLGGLVLADIAYVATSPSTTAEGPLLLRPFKPIVTAVSDPNIRYAINLTLKSCLFTAILSVLVAVPIGYLLSRYRFPGRGFIDAVLDIPIALPPLVVGLSLLILFQFAPFRYFSKHVVYQVPAVVIAQFMVSAAFAVRVMRATFDQIDVRMEQVALTLGCSRRQAFFRVTAPQAYSGMLTAGTLAWARALGEFGPLLIFAGATRGRTEVLSTTVFLELSVGNLEGAVAVSLLMITAAVVVMLIARFFGSDPYGRGR